MGPAPKVGEKVAGAEPWHGMRWLLPLLVASIVTLAVSLTTSAAAPHTSAVTVHPPSGPAPKAYCEHPRALRLHRFEDRSARLECAGRVLLRVSVPG